MEITSVIKYEGDNNTFIWKHPKEDFNSMTQLIVHESQEAIFMMNGQALDTFGPGRYTLETENIPLLSRAINAIAGGDKPFHCEVYFVNKTVQMAVKWGTDSKVRFIEPTMGVPLEIGASGEMNLMVADSRKLLIKLVGTTNGIAWEDKEGFTKSLQQSFRPLISTAVKSNLSTAIKAANINILEIDENLERLSDTLRARIVPGFEEYGLSIPQFYLSNVLLPEADPNFKRLRDIHTVSLQKRMAEAEAEVRSAQAQSEAIWKTEQAHAQAQITAAQRMVVLEEQTTETEIARREAERRLIEAQAKAEAARYEGFAEAEIMRAKGYNEKDVIQAEVQKAYAEGIGNMGSGSGGGSPLGDMMGFGVGMAAMSGMMPQMSEMMKGFNAGMNFSNSGNMAPNNQNPQQFSGGQGIQCPTCGCQLQEGAKFCVECGTKIEVVPKANKYCMNCGAELPANAKFCFECGNKIGD